DGRPSPAPGARRGGRGQGSGPRSRHSTGSGGDGTGRGARTMTAVTDYELAHGYETVNYYRSGGAARIELNRPDRLNAWNNQFSLDLLAAVQEAAEDQSVRAVMITGAGRAFSSGADLRDGPGPESGTQDVYSRLTERYHPILVTIRQMPKPVVSAVNGAAAGIGLSLALVCDLVVAAESAYFLLAFVNIGLVPDGGSSLLVPSRVGFARAAQMALLGERIPARQALDWGLINQVWPDGDMALRADDLVNGFAAGPTA